MCIPGNLQSLGRSLFNAITDVLHCAAQRQMVCRNIIALSSATPQCPCGSTGLQKYNCTEQCPCGVTSNQCRAGDPQCNQDTVRRNSRAPETCQSFCNTFTSAITLQYFYFGHNCSALCHTLLCTCILSSTQSKCWRSDL